MTLAKDLKKLRLDRGLSLTQAAKEIGVSPNTLGAAEEGAASLHPSSALKIASFFGFRVTEVWPIDSGGAAVREVA